MPSAVLYVVPQGSVLGPILFLLCTADVLQLVKFHQLQPHAYADDMQIYGFCKPLDVDTLQEHVSVCIDEVISWMMANRLQFNPAKTEVLWCSSARHQHQIPTGRVCVGNTDVCCRYPLSVTLGSMLTLISPQACMSLQPSGRFAALWQIRSVQRLLMQDALLTLIRSLIITKLDFCCSALTGVSGLLMQRLQSVLNAAARLV